MIREWCCYCGRRLHRDVARGGCDWCTRCSPYEPARDVNTENEVFWQAVAHERNRLANALRLSRELVALIGDGVGDQGVDEFALLLDDALDKAEKGEG